MSLLSVFQIDFYVVIFANFRFLKLNSSFGILSFVLCILIIGAYIFVITLQTIKLRQIYRLKDKHASDKVEELQPAKEANPERANSYKGYLEKHPELESWAFLVEDYDVSLKAPWFYFPTLISIKELVTVCTMVMFVKQGMVQMAVLILLSASTVVVLAAKRQFKSKLANVLNLITEIAFLLIFIGFLVLALTRESMGRYPRAQYIGRPLIALVFVIVAKCVLEYIIFLVELIRKIISYCKKRNLSKV